MGSGTGYSCPVSDRGRAVTPAPPEVWDGDDAQFHVTPGGAGIALRPRSETGDEKGRVGFFPPQELPPLTPPW